MWFVYILQLSNGNYYTGITNDIEKRMKAHNKGLGSKYVRSNLPFKLVYLEKAENRSIASKREIEIKKLSRKDKVLLVNSRKVP
jgi:putative endonuclease